DYDVRAQSQDTYEIDVTGCRYAQFYKELGEPVLGFLLVCSMDLPFAEGFGPDMKLTRTQTIMQGASHCNFRYRRQPESPPHFDGASPAGQESWPTIGAAPWRSSPQAGPRSRRHSRAQQQSQSRPS